MISGKALAELAPKILHPIEPEQIGPVSIDVRLGDRFWTPRPMDVGMLDLSDLPPETVMYDSAVITDGVWCLNPGKFIKARTHEMFTVPKDVACMFTLRSAIAQAGLEQVTSVWARPGWRGQLILELYNMTDKPLLLRPGLRIGQIHVFKLSEAV